MKFKRKNVLIFFVLLSTSITAQKKSLPYGLQMFKNIEQIEYCVPLPLSTYKETYDTERAQHSFVHKKNKKATIALRGFYSDDKNITLDGYYNKTYTEQDEENGKIITKKEVLKNKQCFYAIGYYNNFINQYEFLEITWVRKDEVTKLEVVYAISEKKLWLNRLKVIIQNANCK